MMGYNLFAYCKNNPINYSDSTGEVAILASLGALLYSAAAFVGAVAVTATVIVAVKGAVELGETIYEAVSDAVGEKDSATTRAKAPQSVTESEDGAEEKHDSNAGSEERKLPTIGKPNTDKHIYDEKGLKQTRHYGPDGRAEYDIDYRHPGKNHKFPHKHHWKWKGTHPSRDGAIDIF